MRKEITMPMPESKRLRIATPSFIRKAQSFIHRVYDLDDCKVETEVDLWSQRLVYALVGLLVCPVLFVVPFFVFGYRFLKAVLREEEKGGSHE